MVTAAVHQEVIDSISFKDLMPCIIDIGVVINEYIMHLCSSDNSMIVMYRSCACTSPSPWSLCHNGDVAFLS